MESKGPALPRQHQQQGRGDHLFLSSSSQAGVGSSSFGGPMDDGSNAHWRNRTSASSSLVETDYERKKVAASSSAGGKVQEENLMLTMSMRGSRGGGIPSVVTQAGKDASGFPPLSASKPWPLDSNNNEGSPGSMKTFRHSRPPIQELKSNKRQRQGEPSEVQEKALDTFNPRLQAAQTYDKAPMVAAAMGNAKSLDRLSERMRPVSVDLIVGQDHLLGPRCIIRQLIDNSSLTSISSIIISGPPGSGKTSLVRTIARSVSFRFTELSAATCGVKEVQEVLEEAKQVRKFGERTLLFLDEIHRFSKSQQDSFLSYVEAGHIVFIGATTESPSSYAALLSHCRVVSLNKLQPEHIRTLLNRAISDKEKGLCCSIPGNSSPGDVIKVEDEALQFLAKGADGDARLALNSLELAAIAANAAWESTSRKPVPDERGSHIRGDMTPKVEEEREGIITEGTVTKREVSSSLVIVQPPNLRMERLGNGFGMKRLEVLKESLKKENSHNSTDDYTRPFKRFVGGKEVTPHVPVKEVTPHVPVKEVKVVKEVLSSSVGARIGDAERDGGAYMHDVGAREMRNRDGPGPFGGETSERKGGHRFESANEPSDRNNGTALESSRRVPKVLVVTLRQVQEALQCAQVIYDKTGEVSNIISALHKSMRGGAADAAIYWLARVLETGEDPLYIARGLIQFAAEDVGMADTHALEFAVACHQACEFLNMPECNVTLAQCVTYLALAPKSVMVFHALEAAQQLVKNSKQNEPVPLHLRSTPTQLTKELVSGRMQMEQQTIDFLPPSLRGQKFLPWPEESQDLNTA